MKIVIFGSTGHTGREVVKQALEQGYIVTAFVRRSEKLDTHHPNLKIIAGDVLDPASVEEAVKGQAAVISVIGASTKKSTLRTDGTQTIIRAMEKTGVNRLISQAVLGIGDSRGNLSLFLKYIIFPFVLRHAIADHKTQENVIKQSRLDWTIIRPGTLTNGPRTGKYRHGFAGTEKALKLKISIADLADFELKQLTDNSYLHKTPGISY